MAVEMNRRLEEMLETNRLRKESDVQVVEETKFSSSLHLMRMLPSGEARESTNDQDRSRYCHQSEVGEYIVLSDDGDRAGARDECMNDKRELAGQVRMQMRQLQEKQVGLALEDIERKRGKVR
jgi:hypothetical protein